MGCCSRLWGLRSQVEDLFVSINCDFKAIQFEHLADFLYVCFSFFNFFRSGLAGCEIIVTVQANFIFEFSAFGCYQGHCSVLRAHGDIKHVLCVLLGPWRVLLLKEWLFPVGNDVAVLLGDGGESWGKVFSYGWVKVAYVKGDKCVARSLENPTNKLLRNYFWGKYFQFQKTLDWQRLPTNFDRKPSIRYKVHREGVCTPAWNTTTKWKKKVLRPLIRDTVPALSVYFKRSFYEKMESFTKPTATSPNF